MQSGDPGRSLIPRSRTLLGVRSIALKYLLAETEDRSGERYGRQLRALQDQTDKLEIAWSLPLLSAARSQSETKIVRETVRSHNSFKGAPIRRSVQTNRCVLYKVSSGRTVLE